MDTPRTPSPRVEPSGYRLRRLLHHQHGNVAVEFALILPIILGMLAWMADTAIVCWYQTELDGAVRAGAQYAVRKPTDTAGMAAAVIGSTTLSGIVVTTPVLACECYNGAATSCGSATCSDGMPARKLVTISATYPFTRLFPAFIGPASPVRSTLTFQVG